MKQLHCQNKSFGFLAVFICQIAINQIDTAMWMLVLSSDFWQIDYLECYGTAVDRIAH